MKKFAKVVAVLLVCTMAVAVLVACAPSSDPTKAEAALKKNGYTAKKLTDGITLGITEVALGAERGDLVAIVTGSKTDENKNVQTVTIWYFKDASTAKKYWEKAKSDEDKSDEDWIVAKAGSMIYFGTKAGVNAAH